MLFYSKRLCALLTLKNAYALRLQKKKKKRRTCETISLATLTNGEHMGGAYAMTAPLHQSNADTYGHFSRVFSFFCMRTPHRTCVHFVGLAYMYAKNVR